MKKNSTRLAVAAPYFTIFPALKEAVLERYDNVIFNETGKVLLGTERQKFLAGAELAITGLEIIDVELLSALPELKVIGKYGVGLDMIDFFALRDRGIKLGWQGGVNKTAVAEMALAYMITLLRKMPQSHDDLRRGEWQWRLGRHLTGRTIGIIGCGFIGKELVRLLEPFKCRVLVYDIVSYSEFYREHGLHPVSLDQLLIEADVVTVHTPLDDSTRHLLGSEKMKLMKKGALLINTARGGIVDECALRDLLESGHLGGAALDVFEGEPNYNRELMRLPNITGTCHMGSAAEEAIIALGVAALDGLENPRDAQHFIDILGCAA